MASACPSVAECLSQAKRTSCFGEPPSKRCRAELPCHRLVMGSICTGLATCHRAAAAIQAANRGRLEIQFAFACEIGRAARRVLAADFPGLRVYEDACMDEPDMPECHILTAGFPCQPFSAANRRRKGSGDARSAVIGSILHYIKRARPLIVVLENVIGILSWGHDVLVNIFSVMRELGYSIDLEKLCASKHGGLPQNRRRLYIVAVRAPVCKFTWPSAMPMRSLPGMLSDEVGNPAWQPRAPKAANKVRKIEEQLRGHCLSQGERLHMVVNWHSQEGKLFLRRTPCLTAARGAQGGFWLLGKHRMMTVEELLRLQGFNPSQTQLTQVLSVRQAGALIGNSFALPVIGRVLVRALCSIGCSADDSFV